MQTIRARLAGKSYRILWLGLGLCIVFLVADLLVDVFFFRAANLSAAALAPTPYEIYHRLSGAILVLAFSGYVQVMTWRLQTSQSQLEQELSERRRAEEAAGRAEASYRATIEKATVGIFQSTPEGRLRRGNPALARIFGYDSSEQALASMTDIANQIYVDPAARQELQRQLAERGEVTEFVAENYRRDGQRIWTAVNARAVKDAGGVIGYYEGFITDITASKRAEAEAERLHRQIRLILETAGEAIIGLNAANEIDFVNPLAATMLGYTAEDMLSHNSHSLWHSARPDGTPYPEEACPISATLRDGQSRQGEEYYWRKDGSGFPVEYTVTAMEAGGQVSGAVVTFRDITERQQARAALDASERRFRALIDNSADAIAQVSAAGAILYTSPAATRISGYPAEEVLGRNFFELMHAEDRGALAELFGQILQQPSAPPVIVEIRFERKDHVWCWLEVTVTNLLDEPSVEALVVNFRDITLRKQAEERVRASETRFRALFENAPVALWEEDFSAVKTLLEQTRQREAITDWPAYLEAHPEVVAECAARVKVLDVNQAAQVLYGASSKEELLRSLAAVFSPESYAAFQKQLVAIAEGRLAYVGENVAYNRAGQVRNVNIGWSVAPGYETTLARTVVSGQDFTDRKRAEAALRSSEEKFRSFVEQSSEGMVLLDEHGQIVEWNQAEERITGIPRAQAIGAPFGDIQFQLLPPERRAGRSAEFFRNALAAAFQTGHIPQLTGEHGSTIRAATGQRKTILQTAFPIQTQDGYRIGALVRDITESTRAEEALRTSEERYRTIFQTAAVSIWEEDFTDLMAALDDLRAQGVTDFAGYLAEHPEFVWQAGRLLKVRAVNDATLKMYGATDKAQLLGALGSLFGAEAFNSLSNQITAIAEGQAYYEGESINQTLDGRQINVWMTMNIPIEKARLGSVLVSVMDITARKQAEEALRLSEEKFREMAEQIVDVLFVTDNQGVNTYISPSAKQVFGWTPAEMIGRPFVEFLPAAEIPQALREFRVTLQVGTAAQHLALTMQRQDGSTFAGELSASPLVRDERAAGTIGLIRDVTERQQAHERIQVQLQRLAGLRAIDDAIIGSFDMGLALGEVLNQTATQLHADAACVLRLNRPLQRLTFAAGRGFRTEALRHTNLRLGEGHAGQAALERRTIRVPDLRAARSHFERSPHLAAEGFVAYYAVPLMAKGQIEGVLEVFQRGPHNPDDEWLDFLETLAKQAAIAVDNAQLFAGLQRANADLYRAYDDTIEGWSRALDLRDRETEGHTRRVTDMTLRLARAAGIDEAEVVHIRRGALLHDIGKMGVPDAILLKPGSLTDDEWKAMRAHAQLAYDMLAPIDYLRPALDIPYCHHEKWDGTGYPRGLTGEAIPLAARLFAVVDVWDALRSDRPYRAAWPEAKVLEHLRSLAGSHFDPRAVEVFWQVLREA